MSDANWNLIFGKDIAETIEGLSLIVESDIRSLFLRCREQSSQTRLFLVPNTFECGQDAKSS